ncbi:up-regulator of cell proliferation-like [Pogona vitticeps]
MASAQKPSAIILKARRNLTKALQEDLELTLNVAKYYPFLTRNEFSSLRQIKDPHKCTEILIDTVLRKGESAHRQFLDCLEKLRHVFPRLQPISDYFEVGLTVWDQGAGIYTEPLLAEDEEDPWEMVMCDRNSTEEDLPEKVKPEVIWSSSQTNQKSFRLQAGERSSFRCAYTNLAFDTKEDVTLTYQFDSWPKNLNEGKTEELSVAGPLLIIEADSKEAVTAIHFPHFLCLSGEENSKVRIAYLVRGKVSLEKPDSVGPSHVEVKNPKYGPGGVVLEKCSHQQEIKVHAVALLYQVLSTSRPTFHLYLLPNDPSRRKAVHENELTSRSKRVQKPPETAKPLVFGSSFFVRGSLEVEVCPKELKFRNLDASMEQQYLEVYAESMEDKLDLSLVEKTEDEVIWEACVRRDDLTPSSFFSGQVMGSAPKTIRDHLEYILEDMEKTDLKRFKNKLSEFPIKQGFDNIPSGRLEEADAQDLSKLLTSFYTEAYAVEVTFEVLDAINLKQQAEKLLHLTGFAKSPSSTIPHSKSERNESGHTSHSMKEKKKTDVLPGSSTKRALEEVTVSDDEMFKGRKELTDTPQKEQYDVEGRTIAVIDFLWTLKLSKYRSKKLTLREVLEISSRSLKHNAPQSLEDLPWHFVRKVFTLDVTARSTILMWGEWDYGDTKGKENKQRGWDDMSLSRWTAAEDSVNILDLLCAVLLCSDRMLQQEIFSRMSLCQFALPLLLPPLEKPECTLMLWAMRDIVKQWTPHSLAESRGFREETLVLTPMPTISFVRMGRPKLSKSKLLNEFLSSTEQNHDFFVHQDTEGGNIPRGIADGLVEMAWYFPGGQKSLDLFPEPLAIANLRGDIKSHRKQFSFLTQVSSAVFIIVECIGEKEYALLSSLKKSSVHYYFILEEGSRQFEQTYSLTKKLLPLLEVSVQILVKSASTNMAEFVKKLQSRVHKTISSHPEQIAVQGMAAVSYGLAILVDEDSEECQNARRRAKKVTENIKDVANYRRETLKFQEYLLKNQAEAEKEMHRMESPKWGSRLLALHKQVNTYDLTSGLSDFFSNLQSAEKHYFLKWMKFYLDRISQMHLAKLERHSKEKQTSAASLGVEHFMRELGQVYEAKHLTIKEGKSGKNLSQLVDLPKITADLMLEGFTLELFDEDVSNTPLQWISDVLTELHNKLEGQSKIMVITVLGVQGTEKSTLLNTMFGLQFAVNRGQYGRSASVAFLKVTEDLAEDLGCDAILVIDTEGLTSPAMVKVEGAYLRNINNLATLVAGLTDITIVNMARENTTEIKDVFQMVACAFLERKMTGQKPNCQFVHQNVNSGLAVIQKLLDRRQLLEQLDGMIQAAAKAYKVKRNVRFSDIMDYDSGTNNWCIPSLWQGVPPMAQINRGYSENVSELKKYLFKIIKSRSHKNPPKDIPQLIECFRNLWMP